MQITVRTNQKSNQKSVQPLPSAGKHATFAKRGKTCNLCQARENTQPFPSAGKHATFTKRGKTRNLCFFWTANWKRLLLRNLFISGVDWCCYLFPVLSLKSLPLGSRLFNFSISSRLEKTKSRRGRFWWEWALHFAYKDAGYYNLPIKLFQRGMVPCQSRAHGNELHQFKGWSLDFSLPIVSFFLASVHLYYLQKIWDDCNFGQKKSPKIKPSKIKL